MPVIQRFMMFLKTRDADEFVEFMITCFAAPVMLGLKCGALLNLRRGGEDLRAAWRSAKGGLERRLGLEFAEMSYTEQSVILLIYRSDLLMRRISSEDVRDFLLSRGYDCEPDAAASCVERLKSRFKSEFPHEIGIFLGYPLEDVRGFIENAGKNSKLSGYWKVYGDEARALEKFDEYKRAEADSAETILRKFGFAPAAAKTVAF
jgi:hypothetical protein